MSARLATNKLTGSILEGETFGVEEGIIFIKKSSSYSIQIIIESNYSLFLRKSNIIPKVLLRYLYRSKE